MEILLSKLTVPIFGWVAQLMGWVMNGIYTFLDTVGIPRVALAIIIYTVIVYMLMLPLTIKQQKQARLMKIVQPEISKIQKKYTGRRDAETQMRISDETNKVYAKYGVSPYGTCLPLVIQLPLFYILYQVIYHIPGYVTRISDMFSSLATRILCIPDGASAISDFIVNNSIRINVAASGLTKTNIIDALYLMTRRQWSDLAAIPEFSNIAAQINETAEKHIATNSFLGMNLAESPIEIIRSGFSSGAVLIGILGILIPIVAWFTQWLNYKLMPSSAAGVPDATAGSGNSMKAMNNIMPIFSAFLCLTFSVGIAVYWIAGAIVRTVQQVVINRRMMRISTDELIAKGRAKMAKKEEKRKAQREKQKDYVKNIQSRARYDAKQAEDPRNWVVNDEDNPVDYEEMIQKARPNSITARANMVRKFEEKEIEEKQAAKAAKAARNSGSRNRKNFEEKKPETEQAAETPKASKNTSHKNKKNRR